MIEPVTIRFATSGITEVSSAFANVAAQIRKFEDQATKEKERGANARTRATRSGVTAEERELAKLQKQAEKLERQRTREAAMEAKRRDGIVRTSSEMAGREAVKAANAEVRAAEKSAREIERIEERKMRVRIRSSEMAGRAAVKEAAEEARAADKAAGARGRAGRRIGGIVTSSVGGLLSGAATLAGATLGLGGGFALASAARNEMAAEKAAALLVNTVTTDGAPPTGANVANILGKASQVSRETGMAKADVVNAGLTYAQHAKGGDFGGAMDNMGFFAKMSQVTGADIGELASSAGTLQSQNAKLGPKEMQQMLLDVYAQSKMGSMSMGDIAKQMGTIGSQRSAFTGSEARNQRELFALAQVVAPGGDVAEAGIFTKDFAQEAVKGGKKHAALVAAGVKFDAKTGQVAMSPTEILAQVIAGTGGNITKLNEIFEGRGGKLPGELIGKYHDAGGGAKGLTAVQGALGAIAGRTMTAGQLDQQFEQSMSTPGAKFALALNKMSEMLEEKLEPHLEHFADDTLPKLIPKFEAIISAADKFASWFADNPIKGVGAIVLAAISKDLASAAIGQGVKAIIEGLLRGAAGGVGGGGGGGSSVAGGVGLVAAVAGAAYVGKQLIDADVAGQGQGQGSRAIARANIPSLVGALGRSARAGTLTPADLAAAQTNAAALSQRQGELQKGPQYTTGESILMGRFGVAGMTSSAKEFRELKEKENATELANTTAALKTLNTAIAAVSAAVATLPPIKSGAPTVPITQRPVH